MISVIIPIYNASEYLVECIESILKQTYIDFELLLVDDGSSDESYSICHKYSLIDDRVEAFHNDNNGASFTRNFGISKAKGDYICFIDADDAVKEDYLETLLSRLEKDKSDAVFCSWKLLYGNKTVKRGSRLGEGTYQFDDISAFAIDDGSLSGILFGSVWAALYKTEIIKQNKIIFDEKIKLNEDGLFNLKLLPFVKQFTVIAYDGYLYRQVTKRKKTDSFTVCEELDDVTDLILGRCTDYACLEKQIKRRNVSIVFWNILKIGNIKLSPLKLCGKLKSYILGSKLFEYYPELDFDKIGRYKRLLIKLAYKKRFFLLVCLIKYIKPIAQKLFNH